MIVERGAEALCWSEGRGVDVGGGYGWLSGGERRVLSRFEFTRRRWDWRLGRWTAKHALAARLYSERGSRPRLHEVEIIAAADGAPEAFVGGHPAPFLLSISHSGGRALCVTAPIGVDVGCDVERIEPRSESFARDYFTTREAQGIARRSDGALAETLVWSAKESALKALRVGLRRDTRDVEIHVRHVDGRRARSWRPFIVTVSGSDPLWGWWRTEGDWVYTVAARKRVPPPLRVS